jgi:hypothetical protein
MEWVGVSLSLLSSVDKRGDRFGRMDAGTLSHAWSACYAHGVLVPVVVLQCCCLGSVSGSRDLLAVTTTTEIGTAETRSKVSRYHLTWLGGRGRGSVHVALRRAMYCTWHGASRCVCPHSLPSGVDVIHTRRRLEDNHTAGYRCPVGALSYVWVMMGPAGSSVRPERLTVTCCCLALNCGVVVTEQSSPLDC